MSQQTETVDKLQSLIRLYDEGYRSAVVDRAVSKLVTLEVEQTKMELQRLKVRLQAYEQSHSMSSDTFYQRFRAGELGDDMDFVEWSVFWDMYQAALNRLDQLTAQVDDTH